MSSTLVVYVTRTGHARALAETIAKNIGAKTHEIVDLVNRRGIFGYLKSGAQAARNKATPIKEEPVDLTKMDTIILVQPVWAGSVCPPIRTWLNTHKAEISGKRIAVLATNLGSPGEPLKAKYEAEFGQLAAFAILRQAVTGSEREERIKAFLGQLGPR
jgi:flavodoxin